MEWRPGKWTVHKSKHKWHAAAALKAVQTFAKVFDKWSIIANNCSTFVKGVVGFMSDSDKRAEHECEPITDDFDRLSSFGASIGVELMYMTSKEVVKPFPSQDEGEEEKWEKNDHGDTLAATGVTGERITTHELEVKNMHEVQQEYKENMKMIEKSNNE